MPSSSSQSLSSVIKFPHPDPLINRQWEKKLLCSIHITKSDPSTYNCSFFADVERRRIYDIVNVLESLHMVSRLAKNRYTWHGRHNLNKTLGTLKSVGEENKYAEQIMMIKKKEYEQEFDFSKTYSIEDHIIKSNTGQNGHPDMCFVELPGVEFRAGKQWLETPGCTHFSEA